MTIAAISRPIHLALASLCSKPGDVAGNLAQIAHFARQAAGDGADLLLTPELSVPGYGPYPEVLATAERGGDGPIYRQLHELARQTGVVLCAGFVEAGPKGERFLAHYAIYPDGRFVVQRKHCVTLAERPLTPGVELAGWDYAADGPPADPANAGQPRRLDFRFFEVRSVRFGLSICADMGIKDLFAYFAANDVDVLLGPSGAGGTREQRVTTAELATAAGRETYANWLEQTFFPGKKTVIRCLQYGMVCAAVNQCGFDGQRYYHMGHGTITTPMGEVPGMFHGLANLDRQRPMYTHAVVDVAQRVPGVRPVQPVAAANGPR